MPFTKSSVKPRATGFANGCSAAFIGPSETEAGLTAQLANPEHALGFHKEIYSAIYLRQPEQARQKIIQHLTDTRNLLLRASVERGLELHDLTSIEPRSESRVAGQSKPLGT